MHHILLVLIFLIFLLDKCSYCTVPVYALVKKAEGIANHVKIIYFFFFCQNCGKNSAESRVILLSLLCSSNLVDIR